MRAKHAHRIRYGIARAHFVYSLPPWAAMASMLAFVACWGSDTLERKGFDHIVKQRLRYGQASSDSGEAS
jgi:hypothetical protein